MFLQILIKNLTEIIINYKTNLRKFLDSFENLLENCENFLIIKRKLTKFCWKFKRTIAE